jgi:hypothetical protein
MLAAGPGSLGHGHLDACVGDGRTRVPAPAETAALVVDVDRHGWNGPDRIVTEPPARTGTTRNATALGGRGRSCALAHVCGRPRRASRTANGEAALARWRRLSRQGAGNAHPCSPDARSQPRCFPPLTLVATGSYLDTCALWD